MHAQVVFSDQFVNHMQSGKTAFPKISLEAANLFFLFFLVIGFLLVARLKHSFIIPITPHIYSLFTRPMLRLLLFLTYYLQMIFEEKIVRLDLAIRR